MRTTKKVEKTEVKEEVKKELKECMTLWRHESKAGNKYLTGMLADGVIKVVGYFNTKKEKPNQPDINVYMLDVNGEKSDKVVSLWENIGKETEKKYLSGLTNENEKLVGFYQNPDINNRPFIKVYYKEEN